jgi:hypothetical protein
MIQLFDTQLQVSLRALREVVAPALHASESHVLEQLHLTIATLEFARQRLPYTRSYYRLELNDYLTYSREVCELIRSDQAGLHKEMVEQADLAEREKDRPEAENEDYLIVSRRLRELISDAVAGSSGSSYENELDRLVLQKQKQLLLQQRTWMAPLGLDTKSEELPEIEEILTRA